MDLTETIKALNEEIEDDGKFRRVLMNLINKKAETPDPFPGDKDEKPNPFPADEDAPEAIPPKPVFPSECTLYGVPFGDQNWSGTKYGIPGGGYRYGVPF